MRSRPFHLTRFGSVEPALGKSWRLMAIVGLIVAMAGGSLGVASSASAAVSTWTATKAPLPAGAIGAETSIGGLSCPAAGSCVATGAYKDPAGNQLALIETLSGGSWTQTTAPLPGDAATNPVARLDTLSCPAAGSCVAVGHYTDSSHTTQVLIDTLSGGSWTAATGPLPSDVSSAHVFGIFDLSCPDVGSCVAVGNYVNTSGQPGLIETQSGGSWIASAAPVPAGPANVSGVLERVSCLAAGSCVAVGGSGVGVIETLSDGSWAATRSPLPSGAGAASYSVLDLLSCPAAATCVAGGFYSDTSGNHNLFDTLSGGSWMATPAPALPVGGVGPNLEDLSCPTVGACVAVGDYTTASDLGVHSLLETLSGGSWTARAAPLPAGAASYQDDTQLAGVSCPAADSCVAEGVYMGSPNVEGLGLIETLSGGSWTASEAPLPVGAAAASGGLERLDCPAAGACVIAGDYIDTTDGDQILLDSQTPVTPPVAGALIPLAPARLLDTRSNNGASGPVAAGGTVALQVDGRGGLPASGVGAVVLNVTVTQAKAGGYITAYPDQETRPGTSNLNFSAGQTVPNLVVVPVGKDGKVNLYNGSGGTVQLLADISGYFAAGDPASAGAFGALSPARLLDTRSNNGASGPVAAGGTVALQVDGRGGLPASGVGAVVLNVTVTQAKAGGYITAYPDQETRPGTSNLNFSAGQTVPNLVVVPVGKDGKVDLYNGSGGTVQLLADISGYFAAGDPASAGAFGALSPARLLDTRSNNGASGPVAAGGTVALQVDGRGGLPASGVGAVVLNVTATQAKAGGYITAYPDQETRPGTSNLNFSAGQTVPNLVVVPVGKDGKVDLYNGSGGTVQLLADISGYFST